MSRIPRNAKRDSNAAPECAGHCWHVTSSMTDGMGRKGFHAEVCCWCGERRRNHWELVSDANHGSHCPQSIQRLGVHYEYELKGKR